MEYPITIHSETLCTCNVDNKHMRTTPQPVDSTPLLPNLDLALSVSQKKVQYMHLYEQGT